MGNLSNLKPQKVFQYFEEICAVPRGSGNMEGICAYCLDFAQKHGLKAVKDSGNNIVIYKAATPGYENAETVILQGHLDMVCQKKADIEKDFLKEGIVPLADGNYIKADGTTLGADNGIAVAIALAILTDDSLCHPPIEALFTTDEEIGLIGAGKLDAGNVTGRKMINIDAEEPGTITVSCAGGSDFKMLLPIERKKVCGKQITVSVSGLKGGHSGIEINNHRVNANILMGRILHYIDSICSMGIISVNGGDKGNAITNLCEAEIVVDTDVSDKLCQYADIIKKEISFKEPGFKVEIELGSYGEYEIIDNNKLIFALVNVPNGVLEMSAEIDGLVETSLNLGILKTEQDRVLMQFALRSNKQTALLYLEERLKLFAKHIGATVETSGHYPPWEYKKDSKVREDFIKVFKELKGIEPNIEAIHAGLECGLLSAKLPGLDCIAIGPEIIGAHTVDERVNISSTEETYNLIVKFLENCK